MARLGAALLLVTTAWAARPSASRADEAQASVAWEDRVGDCVSRAELERAVVETLGREAFAPEGSTSLRMQGTLTREGSGLRAELRFTTRDGVSLGERSLFREDPSCAEMLEYVALVVSLALDAPEIGGASTAREPVAAEPPAPPRPPAGPAPRRRAWTLEGHVLGGVALGALPVAGPELTLGLRLGVGRAAGALLAVGAAPFGAEARDAAGVAAAVRSGHARLLFDLTLVRAGALELDAGLGGRITYLAASPVGLAMPRSPTRWQPAADAQLRLGVALGTQVGLIGSVGLTLPVFRDRWVYSAEDGQARALWTPPSVAFHGALGLRIRFLHRGDGR